ncbi:uncharacterized protein FIBRA_02439 [Fibroporia radiculosa]|uniref:DBF4-type domain-containing protein n=1 Tax=Fibroporia radiculosa TaxID=599839 RepID=J4H1V0_9APHY|nr:uncharacterized protein FIBRA_02439 [Fibroporia radiculosa]CCM00409.1 predicted protein [Fibroporia radiculosa]
MVRKAAASKRGRSPDPAREDTISHDTKRLRSSAESPAPTRDETREEKRERRRVGREQEFKVKYLNAFPNWIFYFDLDTLNPDVVAMREGLERRVSHTGARVEDFFSKDITHLITLEAEDADKENVSRPSQSANPGGLLGSPIRLRGRTGNDAASASMDNLARKAHAFGIKVWSAGKLASVLDRCHVPVAFSATPTSRPISAPKERSLTRLLEDERIHGTTSERDPTQKRHDYKYFSKGVYFVLVEDMRQELATIAAVEFPLYKGRDGKERPSWPILYCHPRARGPFIPYDEKEERRCEKMGKLDRERARDLARRKARLREEERKRRTQAQIQAKQQDLRRSVSLNNLHRRTMYPDPGLVDLDADIGEMDSLNASGYLASGAYMAASGNSVGITSTTGTTSTAGRPSRNIQLPVGLRGRIQQQVVTSRKVAPAGEDKANRMGPPATIPGRQNILRKSKSTNTLRLPKREEGVKPGYCESCRVKFEDFSQHINGRRHRKFAIDDSNFVSLDYVLERVRRRTLSEVEEERRLWYSKIAQSKGQKNAEDAAFSPHDDVRWDEWVDGSEM